MNFTGKINILESNTSQILGCIYFIDGQIANTKYNRAEGLKAFYNVCLENLDDKPMKFIVEPELVDSADKKIHHPISVLKKKLSKIVEQWRESSAQKPPKNIKLMINPEFITKGEDVTSTEYDLMCTMSDYNLIEEIYKNSNLLDFEITNTLVSLRKKNALKVIQLK